MRKVVLLAIFALAGCQSPGSYLSNRVRDLGECFRGQIGSGLGVGASVSAAGMADVGLSVSSVKRSNGVGWVYGEGFAFGAGKTGEEGETELDLTALAPIALPVLLISPPSGNKDIIPLHWRVDGTAESNFSLAHSTHACYCLFPGLASGVGDPEHPLPPDTYPQDPDLDPPPFTAHPDAWSEEGIKVSPRSRVHAFDLEARVYAGVVYAKVGFSPGEFFDFLFGWFGIDIAGDDETPEVKVEA